MKHLETERHKIISAILSVEITALSMQEAASRVMEQVSVADQSSRLLGGAIFQKQNHAGALSLLAAVGLETAPLKQCETERLRDKLCACRRAMDLQDIQWADSGDDAVCLYPAPAETVRASIPLTSGSGVFGVLFAVMKDETPDSPECVAFLQSLSHSIATILEQCALFNRLRDREEQLTRAQEIARLGSWTWDMEQDSISWSDQTHAIFQRDLNATPLSYDDFLSYIPKAQQKKVRQAVSAAVASDAPYDIIHPITCGDGTKKIVHERGEVEKNAAGRSVAMHGTVQEITSNIGTAHQLAMTKTVLEKSIEGVVVTDLAGAILFVNPAFSRITGYSAEEAIGRNPRILKSDRHDPSFYNQMWSDLLRKGQWQGNIWNRRKNGELYQEHLIISAVCDLFGTTQNYVAVFHDLSDYRRLEETIARQSTLHFLTGLPNRTLVLENIQTLARRARTGSNAFAVIALDIDNFKHINDSFSFLAGDELLRRFAARLRALLPDAFIGHIGGDDFCVIVEAEAGVNIDVSAQVVFRRIAGNLATPFRILDHDLTITVSGGVTFFPEHGSNAEDLLKNSEIAMYAAKEEGKNSFHVFDITHKNAIRQRLSLQNDLYRAVDNKEFVLFYQPQVSLKDGTISGLEALLRWNHPERGLVSPDAFIPIAEESGLILPIGEWVLETAAARLHAWRRRGFTVTLSVNLSNRQFRVPTCCRPSDGSSSRMPSPKGRLPSRLPNPC